MATTNVAVDDDLLAAILATAKDRGDMKGEGTSAAERVEQILADYIRGTKKPATTGLKGIISKRIKRTANRL